MFTNLSGWNLMIGPVLVIAIIIVIAVVVAATRRPRAAGSPAPYGSVPTPTLQSTDVAEALLKLTALRDEGLITDAEYEAKRAEILGRL